MRSLELARNVVAVPCGQRLHIGVDLSIETSKNQGASINTRFNNIILTFDNRSSWSSQRREVDGYEVEVNVALYPCGEYVPGPRKVNIGNMTEHSLLNTFLMLSFCFVLFFANHQICHM